MRKTSMVPIISDFLFDGVDALVQRARRTSTRCTTCFSASSTRRLRSSLPGVSAGWIEAFDVESGRSRVMSRRELRAMAARVREWQDEVAQKAKKAGLDALRLESDPTKFDVALLEWVAERRLRRR